MGVSDERSTPAFVIEVSLRAVCINPSERLTSLPALYRKWCEERCMAYASLCNVQGLLANVTHKFSVGRLIPGSLETVRTT